MICNKNCKLANEKDKYLTWLVKLLGPVLMGSKPAEIISFPDYDMNKDRKIEQIKTHFKICKRIDIRVIDVYGGSTKVLFYNSSSLDRTLKEYRNKKFLLGIGYPRDYDMNDYLDELEGKIRDGNMPHEIGIFLGYPLKDIIGFFGHPALKLTKVKGWRVYGNPRLSDERFEAFSKDKSYIGRLLESRNFNEVLYMV